MILIKGRKTTFSATNSFYPKFLYLGENDDGSVYLDYTSAEIPPTAQPTDVVYEPVEYGLGIVAENMVVPDIDKNIVFYYPIEEAITWGNEVITFNDPYNYDGELI